MKLIPMKLMDMAGETLAVPVDETAEAFHGVIRLNKTALDIWNGLEAEQTEEEIAAVLMDKYDGVDHELAVKVIRDTVSKLKDAGILQD